MHGYGARFLFLATWPSARRETPSTARLWVGAGAGEAVLKALEKYRIFPGQPIDLYVDANPIPFRVVSIRIEDGSRIYLGLSLEDQLRVLHQLRFFFALLWLVIVLFGFALMFSISRG